MQRGRLGLGSVWLALAMFAVRAQAATLSDVQGHYVGTWTNTTFSSSDTATIDLSIAGSELTGVFAMGGSILGGFVQPDPLQIVGTISGEDASFNGSPGALYGNVVGTIHGATGAFDFTLSALQNPNIVSVAVNGTIVNHVMDLTYDVTFMNLSMANGVLHAPEADVAASELAAAGTLLVLAALARAQR